MTNCREVIFTIKRKHGIGVSEISRRIGMSQGAVNGWFNYGAQPRPKAREKLLKLAASLNHDEGAA